MVVDTLLLFALLLVTTELVALVTLFVATEVVFEAVVMVEATSSGWGADLTARSSRSCECRQKRNDKETVRH